MRCGHRFLFSVALITIFMAPTSAHAQAWSGILTPSRAVDWSGVGVVGGIPARTTICAILSPSATNSQINSAISSCPSGQAVFLSAGTYNIGGIDFNGKSGVTLRGAGANQTFLVFTGSTGCHGYTADVCLDSGDLNWKLGPSNLANWTAGYAKGATSITLSAVPNLKVGSPIILDQLDDTIDTGAVFVCSTTSPPCSLEGNGGNAARPNRDQFQIAVVSACGTVSTPGAACNGTNVTITPGLYMPNWSAASSPAAWWATSPIIGSGIENMSLDHTNQKSSTGIEIFNCANCWVSGVRDIDTARAHVEVQYSTQVTVRDSYFFLTQNSVSVSYGIECFQSSQFLAENNIIQAVATPEMLNGCSGSVYGYNFNINNYYTGSSTYSIDGTNQHTAGIDNILYEGDVGNNNYGDVFHGTHHFVTLFRNYYSGVQAACWISGSSYATSVFGNCSNNNFVPIKFQAYSRFYNAIGNVLGKTGVQTSYNSGALPIISIGSGNSNGTVTVPSDLNVGLTLMLWGNYDTFNAAARFVSSEVPSLLSGVQAPFLNPVPLSQTLPASFYLNAKPKWWPASKAWPPIGPDVTGGNVAGVGGHVYTIPAQDCFFNVMGGPANGTGSVLSFNANTCYGSGTASLPAPPTGLTAIVH